MTSVKQEKENKDKEWKESYERILRLEQSNKEKEEAIQNLTSKLALKEKLISDLTPLQTQVLKLEARSQKLDDIESEKRHMERKLDDTEYKLKLLANEADMSSQHLQVENQKLLADINHKKGKISALELLLVESDHKKSREVERVKELQERITKLESQLHSAREEIGRLVAENSHLRTLQQDRIDQEGLLRNYLDLQRVYGDLQRKHTELSTSLQHERDSREKLTQLIGSVSVPASSDKHYASHTLSSLGRSHSRSGSRSRSRSRGRSRSRSDSHTRSHLHSSPSPSSSQSSSNTSSRSTSRERNSQHTLKAKNYSSSRPSITQQLTPEEERLFHLFLRENEKRTHTSTPHSPSFLSSPSHKLYSPRPPAAATTTSSSYLDDIPVPGPSVAHPAAVSSSSTSSHPSDLHLRVNVDPRVLDRLQHLRQTEVSTPAQITFSPTSSTANSQSRKRTPIVAHTHEKGGQVCKICERRNNQSQHQLLHNCTCRKVQWR